MIKDSAFKKASTPIEPAINEYSSENASGPNLPFSFLTPNKRLPSKSAENEAKQPISADLSIPEKSPSYRYPTRINKANILFTL
ncbi:hypothetical protein OAT18_00215 [Tenacibaculum sp.]|nr:hypothetical protein [Tenacibaculum sp.]